MDVAALPNPMSAPRRSLRLSGAAVEAIGTILAIIGRMLHRAIGGFAHLIAAAAIRILELVIAVSLRAPRSWAPTERMPALHRRWLVAAPARWAAP